MFYSLVYHAAYNATLFTQHCLYWLFLKVLQLGEKEVRKMFKKKKKLSMETCGSIINKTDCLNTSSLTNLILVLNLFRLCVLEFYSEVLWQCKYPIWTLCFLCTKVAAVHWNGHWRTCKLRPALFWPWIKHYMGTNYPAYNMLQLRWK